ncbi:MAG: hypothetical protein EON58_07015 [Alphaproteobacteria bacterium]|nr:MAG: hypothetical protein EON58_07015 [Alphaproteobacteria bacterium]
MTDQLSLGSKLAHNIGLIVLASQELERHLKVLVAASDASGARSGIDLHKRLERRGLGDVVTRFLSVATITEGDALDLEDYFSGLLDRRNKVVHHFIETYGEDLEAGRHENVLLNLATLYDELRKSAGTLKDINLSLLEHFLAEPTLQLANEAEPPSRLNGAR